MSGELLQIIGLFVVNGIIAEIDKVPALYFWRTFTNNRIVCDVSQIIQLFVKFTKNPIICEIFEKSIYFSKFTEIGLLLK